jgi:hypothetical protein
MVSVEGVDAEWHSHQKWAHRNMNLGKNVLWKVRYS